MTSPLKFFRKFMPPRESTRKVFQFDLSKAFTALLIVALGSIVAACGGHDDNNSSNPPANAFAVTKPVLGCADLAKATSQISTELLPPLPVRQSSVPGRRFVLVTSRELSLRQRTSKCVCQCRLTRNGSSWSAVVATAVSSQPRAALPARARVACHSIPTRWSPQRATLDTKRHCLAVLGRTVIRPQPSTSPTPPCTRQRW